MTTFDSLPLEILTRILELVSGGELRASNWSALTTASLVASRWREPAQALLWRNVEILSPWMADRMKASPACGKYRTARAVLGMMAFWLNDDGETIGGTLERLRGIESLDLSGYVEEPCDVAWLDLPSLRDLSNLSSKCKFANVVPAHLRPSFRLRTLTFGEMGASSAALNHALFTSSSSSLLSLTLHPLLPDHLPALFSALPLLADTLPSLSLHDSFPGLAPILSSFTSLTSLYIYIYNPSEVHTYNSFFTALTRPIESIKLVVGAAASLCCEGWRGRFVPTVTEHMRRKVWRVVTEVRLRASKLEIEATPAGQELLCLCWERNVVVVYE